MNNLESLDAITLGALDWLHLFSRTCKTLETRMNTGFS